MNYTNDYLETIARQATRGLVSPSLVLSLITDVLEARRDALQERNDGLRLALKNLHLETRIRKAHSLAWQMSHSKNCQRHTLVTELGESTDCTCGLDQLRAALSEPYQPPEE